MNTRRNAIVGSKPSSRGVGPPAPIEFIGMTNDTCLTECVPISISCGSSTVNDCSAPFATRFRIEALLLDLLRTSASDG